MKPSRDCDKLIEIMAALRTPRSGCPWDLKQTFQTVIPYTIEEAYEVADAVARGNMEDLREELGDLLLQVVFHARMADELGYFDFGDVVESLIHKLLRRHPHVFADAQAATAQDVQDIWRRIKSSEKAQKGEPPTVLESAVGNVPLALPGLTRAVKMQTNVAAVGFDWKNARAVFQKLREETDEVEAALEGGDHTATEEEIGDLLFTVANLARHMNVDPEGAIRAANAKFERRFRFIEAELARTDLAPSDVSLHEMEALWQLAKGHDQQPARAAHSSHEVKESSSRR